MNSVRSIFFTMTVCVDGNRRRRGDPNVYVKIYNDFSFILTIWLCAYRIFALQFNLMWMEWHGMKCDELFLVFCVSLRRRRPLLWSFSAHDEWLLLCMSNQIISLMSNNTGKICVLTCTIVTYVIKPLRKKKKKKETGTVICAYAHALLHNKHAIAHIVHSKMQQYQDHFTENWLIN